MTAVENFRDPQRFVLILRMFRDGQTDLTRLRRRNPKALLSYNDTTKPIDIDAYEKIHYYAAGVQTFDGLS